MRIESKAPTRVDLAGGTLDIWPLYLFHPGAVTINAAITRYASCVIETHARDDQKIRLVSRDTKREENFVSLEALIKAKRYHLPLRAEIAKFFAPQGGFTLTTDSEAPAGAGIGGSSAMAVAICAALDRFTGAGKSKVDWIHISRDAEGIVIKVPTGTQDHYPPAFGGAAAIELPPGGERRVELRLDVRELEQRLVLCYTGKPQQLGSLQSAHRRQEKSTGEFGRDRRSRSGHASCSGKGGLEGNRTTDARGVELPQAQPAHNLHQNH